MERGVYPGKVSARLNEAIRVLTHYYELLDSIPDDEALEDGEVEAGEYLQPHLLSGQFSDHEIVMAHMAVAREAWAETGYQKRIAKEPNVNATEDVL